MLLMTSELFADDNCRGYAVYCLRGGDVVFYAGERGGDNPEVDTVEVHSRGSKGELG